MEGVTPTLLGMGTNLRASTVDTVEMPPVYFSPLGILDSHILFMKIG